LNYRDAKDFAVLRNNDKLPDEDYSKLNERIQKLKLEELFDDDDDGMAGVR
jgi:hypothetical protein